MLPTFMSNASDNHNAQTLRGFYFSSTIGHYKLATGCIPGSDSVPPLTVQFEKPMPAAWILKMLSPLLFISIVGHLVGPLV
jgi:hypothetical protein